MESKPKDIIVKLDSDAFDELKQQLNLKIALEELSVCDEFALMVIKSMYAGLNSVHVCKRKKGEKRTKI